MIERDYNHQVFVLYSIRINESDDDHRFIKLHEIAHQLTKHDQQRVVRNFAKRITRRCLCYNDLFMMA